MTTSVPAAGTVPWRRSKHGRLQVALVHRPRYDDWSWPKGKLDPGEDWVSAAVRETHEEAGYLVRLGRPLPPARYTVIDPATGVADKEVRYWCAQVVGGKGRLVNEIDDLAWLDPTAAHDRLDYARDKEQLRALVRADQEGRLDTWPLVIVRHAPAVPRSEWTEEDSQRPLSQSGSRRARGLVPILSAYGIERLVSSSSARCVDTLAPYAVRRRRPLKLREDLSEEAYEQQPKLATARLERILRKDTPVAICGHGPVIPDLLAVLRERLVPEARDSACGTNLEAATTERMAKGEALVAHLVGIGRNARVVAVERHMPAS
ncbi:MAG: NUDIX hydrolase [Nostocoides sp.]